MSDIHGLDARSGRIIAPSEPALLDAGPSLNETLAELATTLAGIVGVFVVILAVVSVMQ